MVLNTPLSESSCFIGEFITQSINYIQNDNVIDLKGVEAIAGRDTKFTFTIFDDAVFETKKETIETILKNALNNFIKENPIGSIRCDRFDPVTKAANKVPSTRSNIPIPYTHYQIDPKAPGGKVIDYYIRLVKLGEAIHKIVSATLI